MLPDRMIHCKFGGAGIKFLFVIVTWQGICQVKVSGLAKYVYTTYLIYTHGY